MEVATPFLEGANLHFGGAISRWGYFWFENGAAKRGALWVPAIKVAIKSLASFRGATGVSESAFAFAAVALQPRCAQIQTIRKTATKAIKIYKELPQASCHSKSFWQAPPEIVLVDHKPPAIGNR